MLSRLQTCHDETLTRPYMAIAEPLYDGRTPPIRRWPRRHLDTLRHTPQPALRHRSREIVHTMTTENIRRRYQNTPTPKYRWRQSHLMSHVAARHVSHRGRGQEYGHDDTKASHRRTVTAGDSHEAGPSQVLKAATPDKTAMSYSWRGWLITGRQEVTEVRLGGMSSAVVTGATV